MMNQRGYGGGRGTDFSSDLRRASRRTNHTHHPEHLKLVIETLRRRIFGVKSEKIVVQLQQLELHPEELESSQAEMRAAVERVTPAEEPKARSRRKPLPGHLPREVVSTFLTVTAIPIAAARRASSATT